MDLASVYPNAQVPGLTWQRVLSRPDAGLGFGSIRRRLARGHLAPHDTVLAGTRGGVAVVVGLVQRIVGYARHDEPMLEPFLVVNAEIDPPLFAGAAVASLGSIRFPAIAYTADAPGGDHTHVHIRAAELARAFHASAADRERLRAFLGPSHPGDPFPAALARAAAGLGDVALTDGFVEVNRRPPIADVIALVDAAVAVARIASARIAALPDPPPVAAFKAGWAELGARRALAFDAPRTRLFGTLGDHAVELSLEPAYHHVETVVDLRFTRPLDAPFQLEPDPEPPETWLGRLLHARAPGHLRLGAYDVTLDPARRAEPLFAREDVRAALARFETLGVVVVADATSITTRARAPLDAREAEELLDATLALADALTPSPDAHLPYR